MRGCPNSQQNVGNFQHLPLKSTFIAFEVTIIIITSLFIRIISFYFKAKMLKVEN